MPLLYDYFVDIAMLCTSPCCAFARLHHVVTHALYVGLVFCHGKPKGPYHLLNCTYGALCPRMQVRRDDFLDSHIRKCIQIMHHIGISSWHHNEHIVSALSVIIFQHHILHGSLHHHAYVFNKLFVVQIAYHLFSCLLMHDPCVFLCKTKTKKKEASKFTLHS